LLFNNHLPGNTKLDKLLNTKVIEMKPANWQNY